MCTYASKEPDLAIMCINTLRRDWYVPFLSFEETFLYLSFCDCGIHCIVSDNEDPMVRGLALRSICSLKLESMLEYIEQPLKKCLTDLSAYVRKTAVLGILKVCLVLLISNLKFC